MCLKYCKTVFAPRVIKVLHAPTALPEQFYLPSSELLSTFGVETSVQFSLSPNCKYLKWDRSIILYLYSQI